MDNDHERYANAEDLPPDLLALARRYAAQPIPRPTPEQTRQLVDRLLAEPVIAPARNSSRQGAVLAAAQVARWRMRFMGDWFWIGCVLLLAVVGAVTAINNSPNEMVPLVMALPLTAALGLAQVSRTPSRGLRDVEAACPVSSVTVMAAVTLAIVALDCAFGVIATAFLALLAWTPFSALLVAWLGPLLFLAALSLPVALRWGAVPAAALARGHGWRWRWWRRSGLMGQRARSSPYPTTRSQSRCISSRRRSARYGCCSSWAMRSGSGGWSGSRGNSSSSQGIGGKTCADSGRSFDLNYGCCCAGRAYGSRD